MNKDDEQAQGILAWYPFGTGIDPITGMAGRDYSGNNNHLTVVDLGTPVAGIHKHGGFGVDMTSSNTEIHEDSIFGASAAPYSVALWAQVDSFSNSSILFSRPDKDQAAIYTYLGVLNTTGAGIMTSRHKTTGNSAVTTNTATVGVPSHFFGVHRGRNFRRCILDGDLAGAGSDSGDAGSFSYAADRSAIGYLADSTPAFHANAIIWEIRIYNYEVPDHIAFAMWNPHTRHNLIHEKGRRSIYVIPVIGGVSGKGASSLLSSAISSMMLNDNLDTPFEAI